MIRLIIKDLIFIAHCKNKGNNNFLRKIRSILSPSFLCTFIYRTSHQLYILRIPLIPKLLWWINFIIFKVDIDYRAKIYGAIYMPHPISIVIGDGVHSTGNMKIMQGCTLGGNLGRFEIKDGEIIKQPHIFSDCFIGINSAILGPLIFNEKFFVAPHALITKNLPSGLLYGVNNYKHLSEEHQEELE